MKLSFVVPAYNESEGIQFFLLDLRNSIRNLPGEHEIIIVNDGSTDDTEDRVLEFGWKEVKLVNLVSNSGHMAALEAGLMISTGDLIFTLDADSQHPPRYLSKMLDVLQDTKSDAVIAIRKRGVEDSFLRRKLSSVFYRILDKMTTVKIHPDAGDFRLMSRKVLTYLLTLRENQKVFRFLIGASGFRIATIEFEAPKRKFGSSKYTIRRLFNLAMSSIVGFSTAPLTMILVFGLIVLCLLFFYVLFIVFMYFQGNSLPGWTSVMLVLISLSAIQFISLAVVGRYISQILQEVRGRPRYIIRDIQGD